MGRAKGAGNARDRWCRRLAGLAALLAGVSLLTLLTGGLYLELGGFVLSARDPLRPLLFSLVPALAHVAVARERAAAAAGLLRAPVRLKARICALRARSAAHNALVIAAGLLFVVAACWRVRGAVLVARAETLEARGQNLQAGELYEDASRAAFGLRTERVSHAAYCYFRCAEFGRATRLVERSFRDRATMPRLAHKAYMHSLIGLERHDDAAHAARAALAAYPSLAREAEGVLQVAERLARQAGRAPDPVAVRVRFRAPAAGRVELRGSWTEHCGYSHTRGWAAPVAMEAVGGGLFEAALELQPSRELPYGCAARALGAGGEVLGHGIALFHLEPGTERLEVELAPVRSPFEPGVPRERRPGADGVRRVLAIWPDCGSWPLLHLYGQAGRLPNMHALAGASRAFELISTHPPYTSTAYLAMTTLSEEEDDGDFGLGHSLVVQLNGLPLVDRLIPDSLLWRGPRRRTLFHALTDGGVSWSNLVFNDEHLETEEDRQGAPKEALARALADGGADLPPGADGSIGWFVDNTAAKAAAAAETWRRGDLRFLLVRFPAVDIASHRFWSRLERVPHDNPLLQVYEHLDRVVGELRAELDQDDVLILFSDHGIESTLAHHPSCFFFLEDPRLPGAAFEGTLPIREFASLVLSRFGISEGSERLSTELRALLYQAP